MKLWDAIGNQGRLPGAAGGSECSIGGCHYHHCDAAVVTNQIAIRKKRASQMHIQADHRSPANASRLSPLDEQVSGVRIADRFGFQIHADDADGKTVLRNRLRGAEVFPSRGVPQMPASHGKLFLACGHGPRRAGPPNTQLRRRHGARSNGSCRLL
jgi:hypothetical protein